MKKKLKSLVEKTPFIMRFILNRYRPYRGAGIKTRFISANYDHIKVSMALKWHNKNYFGTHFGGSLFSMTDAFYPLMLSNLLGKQYIIWDKEASIKYIKPGRGTVHCQFSLTDTDIMNIKEEIDKNEKMLFYREIEIHDDKDNLIAIVKRTIYIKRKNKR